MRYKGFSRYSHWLSLSIWVYIVLEMWIVGDNPHRVYWQANIDKSFTFIHHIHGAVGLALVKPFKIKALLTYVFHVTIYAHSCSRLKMVFAAKIRVIVLLLGFME